MCVSAAAGEGGLGSKVTGVLLLFCTASLTNSTPVNSTPTPEQVEDSTEDTASKLTTTGEGKVPPLAQDLKDVLQEGVQLGQNSAPGSTISIPVSVSHYNKLNPNAPSFAPLPTTLRSSSSTTSPPLFTKNSIPTAPSSAASSRLNPKVDEFIPGNFPLSPPPAVNGDPGLFGNGDALEEEMSMRGYFEVKDILRGFERAAPTESSDRSSEKILEGAAEMLLKVYNYPGSFNEIGKSFQSTLKSMPLSSATLTNLAEMLIHWVRFHSH